MIVSELFLKIEIIFLMFWKIDIGLLNVLKFKFEFVMKKVVN